jgi:mRNA-degrading endonuclease RelE of RelBE toxin-antitoxin system
MTLAAKNATEERGLTPENSFLIKTYLFEQLSDIAPSFSFYVRRLDKSVRKNSRGKSGKYVLI